LTFVSKVNQERNIDSLRLDGGVLCLDFVNTVHSRVNPTTIDYIKDYGDLLRWLGKCAAVPNIVLSELKERCAADMGGTEKVLKQAREVRDLLYRVVSALAAGRSPQAADLNRFQGLVEKTWRYLLIEPGENSWEWRWSAQELDLGHPVRLVIKSAAELLLSDSATRIKECSACGWVFLDRSKNGSRRWCSMETCGSIDKASRYYYRKKKGAT
jgi:predicted RNA-binding Zn ribbon-like protein